MGAMFRSRSSGVVAWLLVGAALAAAWWQLGQWRPSHDRADTVCMLRRTTALACPGCGMGRAASSLARGEWREATALHPLVWLVATQVGLAWVWWGATVALGRPVHVPGWWAGFLVAEVALFVVVWIVRLVTNTVPP